MKHDLRPEIIHIEVPAQESAEVPAEPRMSHEQLRRAKLIAESRGIDDETAQELVYLRDRVIRLTAAPAPTDAKCKLCGRDKAWHEPLVPQDAIDVTYPPDHLFIPPSISEQAQRAAREIVDNIAYLEDGASRNPELVIEQIAAIIEDEIRKG